MPRRSDNRGRGEVRPFNPTIAAALPAAPGVPGGTARALRARLRVQVGARSPAPAPSAVAAPPLDEDDRRLFERELAGVRPLPPEPGRVPRPGATSDGRPRASRPSAPAGSAGLVVERREGGLSGARAGVSHETLRYLARGQFLAEARCDLHGLRAEAAGQRLRRFLEESVARGRKAVLVVCGRGLHSGPGGPVLLDVAGEILARSPVARHVQAFASAIPPLGGEGALLVLLRRGPASEAR